MGVYIKGMEMPTGVHTVTITLMASGKAFVERYDCRPHVKEYIEYKAVPVPPHGRLIDADALVSRCKDEKGGYYGYQSAILGEGVESAPTIIPAEGGE